MIESDPSLSQSSNQHQLVISSSEYHSLSSTISSLQAQITTLQSSNTLLLQSVQTLTNIVKSNNLQSVAHKLETVAMTLNRVIPSIKSNKITSYFHPQSASTNLSSSITHSFRVTSSTILNFIKNEGLNVFSLKLHDPTFSYSDEETRYVFQCISCNKYHKNQVQGHSKYISGYILTQTQINSISFMKTAKRGIEKHVNGTTVHSSSIELSITNEKPSEPLYIKVETVYFMLKRSSPTVVFKEIMVFLQRLIEHFGCDEHESCLNIGDKQHSKHEAKRITRIYHQVIKCQTIYIINNQSYHGQKSKLVLFALSIDGWSRGIFFFYFFHSINVYILYISFFF